MRAFFLVIGLLLLVGGALEGYIQPSGPTATEIMAVVLLVGGFVLLGIAQILGALGQSLGAQPAVRSPIRDAASGPVSVDVV